MRSEFERDNKTAKIDSTIPGDLEDGESHAHDWISLFSFTEKQHIPALSAAVFFAMISGLVVPMVAIIMGKLFGSFASFGAEEITSSELVDEVKSYVFLLAMLGVGSWFSSGAFFACWGFFGELQAKVAREKLFEGLVDKDMEWYDTRKSDVAGLISGVQTQTKELQIAVSQPLGFSVQALVTAAVSLSVSIYTCWSLTLITLIGVPFALVFLGAVSRRMQPAIDTQKEHLAKATRTVNRAFTAIEAVKAFNGQQYERNVFAAAAGKAADAYIAQAHDNALITGFIRLITLSMFVQGFWYGSRLVRKGQVSAGDVMTTFWSCLMATQSLESILPQVILLEKGRAAGASLKALLVKVEKGKQVFHMSSGTIPTSCNGEIRINNISFAYPSRPDHLVLDGANMFIPSHETTFIVGRSGSGKSTLGNLILKAYEPLSGSITLDGAPVKDINHEWLRSNVTLVQQESVLFNETIFRNIAFGRRDYENVTQEQVHQSCRMSMLEDTLRNFPLGFETMVGVGGAALSGGQRQRVALARAIIRNTPILVLDEATSSLDYVSRSLVMDAIHTWRRGKTTIIITHDISQIATEDLVYVLEKGKVVQGGYRSDLDSVDGLFQDFVKVYDTSKQTRRYSLIPEPELGQDSGSEVYGEDLIEGDLDQFVSIGITHTVPESPTELLTGIEMHYIHSTDIRDKRRSSLLERRLKRKTMHFDYVPNYSPTFDIGAVIPATPRRKPVRSFESKQITLKQIFSTIWPSLEIGNRFLLVSGFMAAFFHASATPTFSYALARLLSSFFEPKNPPSESTKWSLVVLCIAAVDATNSYLMHYLLESVAQSWIDALRIKSFARILDQPRLWFDENPVGAITEDLEKNAEEMRNLLGRFAGYTFVGATMVTIGISWSFTESWQLTMVGLSIAPVMYGMTRIFTWISDEWERKSNEAAEVVGGVFDETITNIKTVKGLALERYFRVKCAKATCAASSIGMRRSLLAGIGFGLSDSTVLFATALIFWYGAVLIAKGLYDIQNILTVFTLLLFSLAAANTIVGFIPQISNCKDTARRVLRLYSLPRNSHETHGARTLDFQGDITFSNVTFAYPTRPDTAVLRDFSLKIAPGECVAIAGLSGCGKSTIAALLQRLYPHSVGSIAIDAFPIESINTRSLRSQIAVVSQSVVLFGSSVYDNISYGGNYTCWEVERAAKAAGIHEFIMGLKDGYSTHLGDNGGHLSGGQAQRLGIARALVRRPAVLILDECTSNLDSESAKVIHETINLLVSQGGANGEKMTVIIITHSQEMMRCAERVVVMSYGEVVESGGLEELLGQEGELRRLLSKGEWVKNPGHS